jgi:ComF family protein
LIRGEYLVCLHCIGDFPKTNFHLQKDNPVEQLFWGRTEVFRASAGYFFTKEGSLQKLLHQLKYKGIKEIGTYLGEIYGLEIKNTDWIKNADGFIPVPLHRKKFKIRGYNQSLMIAEGLSSSTGIPFYAHKLQRKKHSASQTRKGRYERYENVKEVFVAPKPEFFKDKHWVLVDDVITTGSTLEACAEALKQCGCASVSVVTIACGMTY